MIKKEQVKAIAFDFGGTLDSPFLHWMDIYIKLYNEAFDLGLNKENFRDAYVQTERLLDRECIIKPEFSLFDTQYSKTKLHVQELKKNHVLQSRIPEDMAYSAAQLITDYSSSYVKQAECVLKELSANYKLLLVSNYYGNLRTVVSGLGIDKNFISLTDSTIEDIRKPDARLWQLAIERAGLLPNEVLIVGDSMKNDIVPGLELGCQVVQGIPKDGSLNDSITQIKSIDELLTML